jgi:hypothetical protein
MKDASDSSAFVQSSLSSPAHHVAAARFLLSIGDKTRAVGLLSAILQCSLSVATDALRVLKSVHETAATSFATSMHARFPYAAAFRAIEEVEPVAAAAPASE